KKKYFLTINKEDEHLFAEEDSEKVEKMSVKDSLFVRYLNKQVNDNMLFTIQEKCSRLINAKIVNDKLKQLNKQRETAFLSFFKKQGVESRVNMNATENTIPYNGFSIYKIEYKGEIPESLRKAYQKMNELNDEFPRKKFLKERIKTINAFR